MNLLGKAIKHNRMQTEMSAAALSRAIDKSSSYVAKVESGSIDPSVQSFARIALVLKFTDTEIAWLVRTAAMKETE